MLSFETKFGLTRIMTIAISSIFNGIIPLTPIEKLSSKLIPETTITDNINVANSNIKWIIYLFIYLPPIFQFRIFPRFFAFVDNLF